MSTPCSLAALGMVNGLGSDLPTIWRRTLAGDQSGFGPRPDLAAGRQEPLAAVDDATLPAIPASLARYACRNNAFSLAAFAQIEDAVRDAIRSVGADRVGVVMGTSTSGSRECEAAILHEYAHGRLLPEFCYPQLELGGAAGFLAELLDLRGPALSISTACSSGARALASARSLLALGLCDAVLAGGSDSLCGLTTHGFASLKAVSPTITNPFSANREGLSLGEGAALFLVTRESEGIQLLGVGESSEAHHISSPDPEGGGAAASMRGALEDAGLDAGDIAYLNLHGTGTRLNDAMESRAVVDVLGPDVPCSSTKSLMGHTLGAAGAIELGICWMSLDARDRMSLDARDRMSLDARDRMSLDAREVELPLPPHVFDGVPDPELPRLHLTRAGESVRARRDAALMTNSFGFGGNNCTLILGEARS